MKNEVNRALVAKKTKEFYGFPREGFTPETRELSNDTIVAHAAQTPFWLTQSGLVFALTKDGVWKRRTVSGLKGHPAYGRRQANGCHSGERYPHLGHARKNYAAHKLMALAWLGPIPAGWEVDHINGNILDWTLQNIQIVSVAENRKRAKYLRVLRQVCPLHAQTFQRDDYLEWFKMPFEEFKASLTRGLGELVGLEQMMKESFYDKE